MFNKKITVKLLSVLLVVTLMFSVSLPLTASAIVAGEDTPQEFHYLTLEEMQELSQAELVAYCRAFYAHEFPEESNTVNPENIDPNQIDPQWSSDNGGDYNNPTTKATHYYLTASGTLAMVLYTKEYPFTENDIKDVMEYSERPDRIDESKGFYGHFYDPETGGNYLIGVSARTEDTAKTNFIKFFNQAVNEYKAGKRALAMQDLGRSLHFIQDVCEPHHSNNITVGRQKHQTFENWVADNLENLEGTMSVTQTDFQNIRYSTLEKIFMPAAWSGKGYLGLASGDDNTFRQAADVTVPNACKYTAFAIYYFICRTGMK